MVMVRLSLMTEQLTSQVVRVYYFSLDEVYIVKWVLSFCLSFPLCLLFDIGLDIQILVYLNDLTIYVFEVQCNKLYQIDCINRLCLTIYVFACAGTKIGNPSWLHKCI